MCVCLHRCPAGSFGTTLRATHCRECPAGGFCAAVGAASASMAFTQCPAGTYNPETGASSNAACIACPVGTANPVPGSVDPAVCLLCLPGTLAAVEGTAVCQQCQAGQFQRQYGQTACEDCIPGFYCREGAAESTPCPAGHFGNATGLYSPGQCTPVAIDFWAPLGSPLPEPCPTSGFYCPGALRDEVWGGAKPVLMPVGQSTRQEEWPALEKRMELTMSIDEFAAQRKALKIRLAAQYGVGPSLITLEATSLRRRARALQSGAIELIVTIATTDGSGNSVDLATLEQSVAAVDDAVLASTISAVAVATGLPPVTVTSQPATTSTVRVTVSFSCPRGKWCTAGRVVDCSRGTYNPLEDQRYATACIKCPPNSHTLAESAASRSECVCDAEYYDSDDSVAVDHALDEALLHVGLTPLGRYDAAVSCRLCPVGTHCTGGATLLNLPMRTGYFRATEASDDVRRCPDAAVGCAATGAALCPESKSGCRNSSTHGTGCAEGLRGAFCLLCMADDSRTLIYRAANATAVARCVDCQEDGLVGRTVGEALMVAAILLACVVALVAGRRCLPTRFRKRIHRLMLACKPANKLKIAIGFCALRDRSRSAVAWRSLPPLSARVDESRRLCRHDRDQDRRCL